MRSATHAGIFMKVAGAVGGRGRRCSGFMRGCTRRGDPGTCAGSGAGLGYWPFAAAASPKTWPAACGRSTWDAVCAATVKAAWRSSQSSAGMCQVLRAFHCGHGVSCRDALLTSPGAPAQATARAPAAHAASRSRPAPRRGLRPAGPAPRPRGRWPGSGPRCGDRWGADRPGRGP